MDVLTARPQLLKQANRSLIRRAIKNAGTATRAEIAEETRISSTTVRSLLTEMMENGEIESMGYDESSGGRKAERYRFRPDCYHAAAFCMTDDEVHYLLINVCGEIVEKDRLSVLDGDVEGAVFTCMDDLTHRLKLRAIGLGVPGVVEGGRYWKKRPADEDLRQMDFGERLTRRYGLPVVMENDLKATAIGFGRCYRERYPDEDPESTNMAYLSFENGCASAAFLVGGKIVRGHSNFAGEISLIPMEDGSLCTCSFTDELDDLEYVKKVAGILVWICGILNPQYIALGGPSLRDRCIGQIGDELYALLPRKMCAEILYAPDMWRDYHLGMAQLTAAKMFDAIQIIKE